MNYDWLFSFVTFADTLNFTRAAGELHITQPALHTQIRKLGESVGRPLYGRKGRSLFLTSEGKRLAAYGREVQERGAAVLAEVRGEAQTGPVILASGQGAFQYLLGPAIRRFPKDRWPLRLLTMTSPETIEAVTDARVHLGVVATTTSLEGLDVTPLRRVGQMAVLPGSHRLARKKRLALSDVTGERLVVAPQGRPHRAMLDQAFATAGVPWNVAVEATGWDLLLRFVRYGVGIAIVNDFCELPRGLVGIAVGGLPSITYQMVTRQGARGDPVQTMIDLILQSVATG